MSKLDLFGDVDVAMYEKVCKHLKKHEDDNNITVDINSTGGCVYDALAIAAKLRSSGKQVTTRVFGSCFSATTLISACGHDRRMHSSSWWMLHDARSSWKGNIVESEHNLRQLKREERQWLYLLEEYTNVPAAMFAELSAKSKYLTAKECRDLGIITEIIY